jgi:peptidyl-prolyl cis-trans isomerase SDCCAG10
MSSVYITEPNTRGKVVVKTSGGDIDIELWPQEAPKACRNFVQLCLEGYYDDTIFHRAIKKFMLQGGDPSGTGQGGESIYGKKGFEDEFHSRLRFNHRGQVACANENTPNSNHSQFFFTLDSCEWLKGKHTIFGKVTGNTIFNILRMGDVDTDKEDRPLEPHRIIGVEVLDNPFDDIIPREIKKVEVETADDVRKRKRMERKGKKDLKLLSFGEEAEEEEKTEEKTKRVKSSHDVDPTLCKEVASEVLERKSRAPRRSEKRDDHKSAVRDPSVAKDGLKSAIAGAAARSSGGDSQSENFEAEMLAKMRERRSAMKSKKKERTPAVADDSGGDDGESDDDAPASKATSKEALKGIREEYENELAKMKAEKRATKVITGDKVRRYRACI